VLPLPSRSHPQKRNRAVYTKELTHLKVRGVAFATPLFIASSRVLSAPRLPLLQVLLLLCMSGLHLLRLLLVLLLYLGLLCFACISLR